MTLTGKETQTGGPIDHLFSEQRPGAHHCGSSIDIRSAAFCTHGRHKRTTTARVTDRGGFSTPPVTTTKMLGRMRQHEKHRTGSSPYTAPGISGSLSTLPLSKSSSEHVSRFHDPYWKRDTNGGPIDYPFSAQLAVTGFCCCFLSFCLLNGWSFSGPVFLSVLR